MTRPTSMVEENNFCPVCRREGELVKNITVKHMLLVDLTEQVGNDDYNLCMDENCPVTYFNRKLNIRFDKQQVKVPIWFKKDANPQYACYCSKVTEEEVINAVVKDGAENIKDVLKLTGAMKNAQCQNNNPLGKCCQRIIQNAINKGLSQR